MGNCKNVCMPIPDTGPDGQLLITMDHTIVADAQSFFGVGVVVSLFDG